MTGIRYEITLNDLQLQRGLNALARIGTNLTPLLTIAGGIFENSTRERFDLERGPGGIPWPTSWRAAHEGGKTLTKSGLLRGSVRSAYTDRSVETGFDGRNESSRHAATHQWGAIIRPVNAAKLAFTGPDGHLRMVDEVVIPARPMVGIDDQDMADLVEAFTGYIEGELT